MPSVIAINPRYAAGLGGLWGQIGEEQPRRLMAFAPISQQGAVQAGFFRQFLHRQGIVFIAAMTY